MAKKRKERKKIFSMPLHKRRKLLHAKKGYKVKIMRGAFKGKEGNVIKVSYKKARIYIEGITKHDARGKEKLIPIHPSNVMILSIS
ncbi:MAG: 50S ribosomal protein L24 [Candidatus Anstonellales archaeon]